MKHPGYLLTTLFLCLLVPSIQAQTLRSDATENQALSGFGNAVAIGDGEIFVSEAVNTYAPGFIYVYRPDESGAWKEHAQLTASDASNTDRFGRAMAVEGSTLIVGATSQDNSTGTAYVFEKDGASGEWVEVAHLRGNDIIEGDAFGRAVALKGNIALISSAGHNEQRGAVYVFQRDPATGEWSEQAKLEGSNLQPQTDDSSGDLFGLSLAFDGERAFVGSPVPNDNSGAVYVFRHDASTNSWQEETKLEATTFDLSGGNNRRPPRIPEPRAQFGTSISLFGEYAFIGAPGYALGTGAVYVFQYDADRGAWRERMKLLPFDAPLPFRGGSAFGSSLTMHEDEIWAGAPGSGAIYRIKGDEASGSWLGAMKLAGQELSRRSRFGGAFAVKGNLAVVGAAGEDSGAGVAILFEHNEETGEWQEQATLLSEPKGLDPIVGGQINCTDGNASLFDCKEVDLVSFLPVHAIGGGRGVRTNDVWGWTDPQTGKEYALVGRLDGTGFVDISDPYNPVFVGNLAKTEGSPSSTWRDIKVYKDHAFIVADGAGEHGMQVFDLSQLRTVTNPPVEFTETAHYDKIHSAHNIVINEETGFAYSVGSSSGGETCGGGLHMINIQEPTHPTFAGCFADPSTGRASTGYSHDAQCVTYLGPDTEHQGKEICFGSNETALSIADVTDKDNPVPLSTGTYPNVGYSHQGWLTEDHRYFFLDDELDELQGKVETTRTLIWDVTDLDDPVLVKEHFSDNKSSDHNLYIRGNTMYQSNYDGGLRVFDITDVSNPVEIGYFDTVPAGENGPGFGGSWSNYPFFQSGVIVVTSGSEGVFILKKKDVDI
ncbi:MAG: choice-of-anchor B family protein [Rhodothermales bacterium]